MKKLALITLISCFSGIASATELWWMVDKNATLDSGEALTWNTATLYASADGSNFGGTPIGESWTLSDMQDWGFATTELGDYSSSASFYVELLLGNGNIASSYVNFRSETQMPQGATPRDVLSGAMYNDGMSMATPYAFSQFTTSQVVPEPTSGLLMLIGLAGLALKRKRA